MNLRKAYATILILFGLAAAMRGVAGLVRDMGKFNSASNPPEGISGMIAAQQESLIPVLASFAMYVSFALVTITPGLSLFGVRTSALRIPLIIFGLIVLGINVSAFSFVGITIGLLLFYFGFGEFNQRNETNV